MDLQQFFARVCQEDTCPSCSREREYHDWILRAFKRTSPEYYYGSRIDRPTSVKCDQCHGTGSRQSFWDFKTFLSCPACKGRGRVRFYKKNRNQCGESFTHPQPFFHSKCSPSFKMKSCQICEHLKSS